MILRGWSIDGYGPFHQQECRGLGDGLTVVLGPNESGKSTMIAFVRGVLFGFPDRRSRDQQYPPLRGGRHGGRLFIDTPEGPVTVEREAGRWNPPLVTLPGGIEAGEAELGQILGGLDLAVFRNIFAFGLTELNDFTALDAGGMGQRLFSAGLTGAGRSASEAIEALGDQAARLLRPRGSSAVAGTLAELTGLEERIAAARSALAGHPGLVGEEEDQRLELDRLSGEVERLRGEEKRLERLLDLWPSWNQRRQAVERLGLLPAEVDRDPDDRLRRLADRLEDEAPGQIPAADEKAVWIDPLRAVSIPLLAVLSAGCAAGLAWRLRSGDWPLGGLFALGALAAALAALVLGRQHLRDRRRDRRRSAASAANMAAAARDLAGLRRTLCGTAERQSLEQTVRQIDTLVASRTGVDEQAASFIDELDSGALEAWERDLGRVRQELDVTEEQRDRTIRAAEALRRQREELEQSADLPTLETEAETVRARLGEETGQWRLLVTARGLVEEALREFVAGRQPAVMERASRLFGTVTGGRYHQVVQEPQGNGLTLLAADGRRLGAADLSRGTAEQLYLCLRLALAEDFSSRGEPLPLLMDDVLVNADPQRARGLAAAIGEYSGRGGQVLVFTCHPGTAELLEGAGGADLRRLDGTDY